MAEEKEMAEVPLSNIIPPQSSYEGSQANQIFRVKKTQIEMLTDRGYDTSADIGILKYTVTEFINFYTKRASDYSASVGRTVTFKEALTEKYSNPHGNEVAVYYLETPPDNKKTGSAQIKMVVENIKSGKIFHVILITETPLTPESKKDLSGLHTHNIEHFRYEDISYNPTHHVLVPKHRLLSEQEKVSLLNDSNFNFSESLEMSAEDIISRYYGAKPGQMFEIVRKNLNENALIVTTLAWRAVTGQPLTITTSKIK